MKIKMFSMYLKIQSLLNREEGQDLIEYALLVALIAFGVTAGMHSVANAINNAFDAVGTSLQTAI
jgi:pilus assembly protein Flp/PilA